MQCYSFGQLSSPHKDVVVVLGEGVGRPVTLYLTVALAVNSRSSTINRLAEGPTAPSAAQHSVESSLATAAPASKPLSASTDNLPVQSDAPAPPTTDCEAEILPAEKALNDADDAMNTMDLYNSWENALGRIRWVMETVDPVAGVRTLSLAYFMR
jgi:hypothetical protein